MGWAAYYLRAWSNLANIVAPGLECHPLNFDYADKFIFMVGFPFAFLALYPIITIIAILHTQCESSLHSYLTCSPSYAIYELFVMKLVRYCIPAKEEYYSPFPPQQQPDKLSQVLRVVVYLLYECYFPITVKVLAIFHCDSDNYLVDAPYVSF